MGIQGLLQFIKEAAEPSHVKKYQGMTVAVDTYCWLHKGAYACAEKLARGEPTDFYVGFCMKFVHMLLSFGIKPILVFDGCTLPSKKEVEKARRERRQASLLKGKQLLQEGRLSEARECFGRSVNITHAMAHEVIKAARAQGVDCIVAPYEADAQLAYLNKTGMVQAIITEDSDLLAFGCKKVFLKIDKFGNGLEIDQTRLGNCKQLGNVFTEEKFRYMCILSGCDYLPSIHGIGLAKACKLLKLANNPDIIKVIKKMGQYLKMNITVPEEYIQGFTRANNTFLYQLVFDPVNRKLVPLNAYGDDIDPETLTYAGRYPFHVGDDTAFQIAVGNIDINTMEQIDSYNPDMAQSVQQRSCGWNDRRDNHVNSIWSREYKFGLTEDPAPPKVHFPEKPLTKGMEKIISVKGLKLAGKELFSKRPRSGMFILNKYMNNSRRYLPTPLLIKVSRFFCNDAVMFDSRAKKEGGALTQDAEQDCQIQEIKHVAEDVSRFSETEKSPQTVFTPPGKMQKSSSQCFSGLKSNSGNLGPSQTVFSQQFHQQRNNCILSQEDQINVAVCDESEEESSPLIELEQSSQSHGSCEPSECSLESSEILQVSSNSLGPKVPGLRKSSNIRSHMATKLKPLIPAKVEWVVREYEKLPSCRKSDPLSPIKDNIQLTPETEEEIFNHLERSHVQRAIFQ
ncbi:Exonuclease 1 [Lonchura striata]|uniref:Exonuclease 1 n=1 Tax=Lonchura striata TaxID=40157 RepID=A0A218VB19_9PASE|nr:Exonuclease 1 [Lonchura striata domestica]